MIGFEVARVLPYLRQEAVTLMPDYGVVTRPGGPATFNPSTGLLTPSAGTVVHEGRCRVRQPTSAESEVIFGEEQVTLSRFMVIFPHDVTGVRQGDTIAVTVSDDADVLGREFRIVKVDAASYAIYKAFACEVVEQ